MKKWNHLKQEYEEYTVPEDWKVSMFENDMDTEVNCCQCGSKVAYGNTYSSQEVHSELGLGYATCEKCHEEEMRKKLKTWKDFDFKDHVTQID